MDEQGRLNDLELEGEKTPQKPHVLRGIQLRVYYNDNAGGHMVRRIVYAGDPLTVGRSQGCKLILVDPFVSSLHARLTFDSLNGLVIEDCDSANGVYVNGERILKQCKLTDDDTVRMGSSRLQFILAGPVRDEDGEETIPAGTRYRVPIDLILEYEDNGGLHREHMTLRDTARIGRDRRSEIYLDDTGVSHFHAKLINCGQGRVGIQDTDSVNGVLLNGAYIDKLELVRPNDEIMLGNVRMLVYYQEKK